MNLDPRIAQMIIEAVDTRVVQLMKQRPYTAYGTVSSVDATAKKANIFISGDNIASVGFSYSATPIVGERVRVVIDPRGDRYIEAVVGSSVLLRWVPIDPYYVLNGLTTTVTIGITTLEVTNVPVNVQAVTGYIRFASTAAPTALSRLSVHNWSSSQAAITAWATTKGLAAGSDAFQSFILETGGTNGRSIKYEVVQAGGAPGTMTCYIKITGYFI
ncbi:MAG: hypothetical protein H0U13_04595 [Gemmatimonadaceae bacterium]|nr:hypothetical protein [Gemmatimonadaceae bacterium]